MTGSRLRPNRSDQSLAKVERTLAERSTEFERLVEQHEAIIERGTPANTKRAYATDWKTFRAWAEEWKALEFDAHGLPVVPLDAQGAPVFEATLLLYLTHLADRGKKPNTIDRAISGIAHYFTLKYPNFKVRSKRVELYMRKIRVSLGSEVKQAAALLVPDLERIIQAMGEEPTPLWLRDRALVLLGWSGAFRRSEVCALEFRDITRTPEGLVLHLGRSKTDQARRGVDVPVLRAERAELCPVRALDAWLEHRGEGGGSHVFCKAMRRRLELDEPMPADQMRWVLARWVRIAALTAPNPRESFSPHSLRAGFITEAARAGVPDRAIMDHSRHKTHRVFAGYVRKAKPFQNHPGKGLL